MRLLFRKPEKESGHRCGDRRVREERAGEEGVLGAVCRDGGPGAGPGAGSGDGAADYRSHHIGVSVKDRISPENETGLGRYSDIVVFLRG